jgi:DNA-binding transcriptional ArsR family regulator
MSKGDIAAKIEELEALRNKVRAEMAGAVREAILGKLSGGNFGSMSAEDLAAATGQRIGSVRAALKALEQKGQVTQSGENWLLSSTPPRPPTP